MLKGARNVWDSYPIYPFTCFQPVAEAYSHLQELYEGDYTVKDNDFLFFLQKDTGKKDIWSDIRQNVADFPHFVKAFHQKADGLRILQYVRSRFIQNIDTELDILILNMRQWVSEGVSSWFGAGQTLASLPATQMDVLRNSLFQVEMDLRKEYT